MATLGVRPLAVVAALALVGCGPVPGGSLSGTPASPPADWSGVLENGRELCEIESRPADPHSIQLECFLYEGALMAQSHRWVRASWWPVESWALIWLEHPDVVVRLDDQLYELRAVELTDAPKREAILKQRGYDPVPPGIILFRFEPRS